MATEVSVDYEPLPGYRLIQHLGDGGYGEVWMAEAPGGLNKAIKFVYGRQDEKRARSELRALEKVRSLRHPFLLSLERIEAVDGRLLIVTELADESIRDRFESYREQGLPGIPRDELLNCLRDAADALDYLSARHALQHLDIKPENLLLVAGHVKVADYGLVKSVQQTEASLVGGMTPLYSAPEVFRGSPSRRSDQYSLAILYQEMLTGTIPFAGGNAAELTLQHLNDEPELSSLCSADRCIVSRALAKEPEHRYPTCLEFIDALRNVTADGTTVGSGESTSTTPCSAALADTAPRSSSRTEIFGEGGPPCSGSEPLLIELPPGGAVTELPPVEVKASDFRPSPALVLGIGGAAGHVLAHLRSRLAEQIGDMESLPTVQMLLIDTDPKALAQVSRRDAVGLAPEETLSVPLHRPQHYREQSDQLLRWLGRRWLYNVPRSLRTEGLRPLGRLALADHARQVYQRIRLSITQAIDGEAVTESGQATDQAWRDDAVRVYVVASISGGTGSGMTLDLGYAVQTILAKLEITDACVVGVMMHSTGKEPRHCELARVNAYSWLTEFQHFSRPDSAYPGDVSCGLPAQEPGKPPFTDTYFVHLGDDLNGDEFDTATQSVADYLLLDLLTPAQSFFDQCREETGESEEEGDGHRGGNLRSFGVCHKSAASGEQRDELAEVVCRHLLTGWQNVATSSKTTPVTGPADAKESPPEKEHGTEPVVQGAVQLVRRLQLEPAAIAANVRSLMEATLGCDATTYLSSWLADPASASLSDEVSRFAAIDQMFQTGQGGGDQTVLGHPLSPIIQPLEEKLRGDVRRWVVGRLNDPQERLTGARQAAAWLDQHFRAVEKALTQLSRNTTSKLSELQHPPAQTPDADLPAEEQQPTPSPEERLALYFRSRLDLLAFLAAGDITRRILSDLKATADQLTAFGRELNQITITISGNAAAHDPQPSPESQADKSPTEQILWSRLPELAAAVEKRLQTEFLEQNGGLLETVLRGGRQRAQFCAMLQEFARQAVYDALRNVDVLADMLHRGDAGGADESPLKLGLASATPPALKFGGARRVLAVLPKDRDAPVDKKKLSQALGTQVSLTTGYDSSLQLCVEAEQLSLPHVAVDIVQHRRDCTDFARRVHTRTDIAWSPLVDRNTKSPDGKGSNLDVLPSLADPMDQATQMISCHAH